MKISINLDFVYDGVDYREAMKEIKEIGFDAVEVCFMKGKSIEDLIEVQKETGLDVEVMLSEFVNLTDASKEAEFIEAINRKIVEAKSLNCNKIIIAVGDDIETITHEEQLDNILHGIEDMLPLFEEADMLMLIEPINNRVDHMGCGLWSSKEAFSIAKKIDSPHVKVLFDIYHMQVMEGDVTRTMIDNLEWIGHIHCAGNPGRNELFIGELNYPEIIRYVKNAGYNDSVGIEYTPTISTKEGLQRIREMFLELL